MDTIIGDERLLELCISPTRNVNRLDIYTNEVRLNSAEVKGIKLNEYYLKNRKDDRLITHFISENEDTELIVSWPKGSPLQLKIYESSTDLLDKKEFDIPQRPATEIPMPFVLNDALLWTKTYTFGP